MSNDKTRNAQKKSDQGKNPPARRKASKNKDIVGKLEKLPARHTKNAIKPNGLPLKQGHF